MKKYVNILFAAAVATLALVSCAKEQEVAPGTPDAEDCYGVYFPKQDVIEEMQVLDPTQAKEVIIKVARGVSDGALTIKPTVSLSEITANGLVDGDVSLFTVPDIVFEDGQAETDLKIVFPNVKEGIQYSLHLAVEGDQYTSKYSSKLNSCDYKLMCVAYQDFVIPETDTPAKVTFTHGWWGETHTAYIKYYEVDGIRHCQTYGEELVGEGNKNGGFWGMGEDQHLTFLWYREDDPDCSEGDGKHPHTIPAGYEPAPEGAELITFDGYQIFDFGWSSGMPTVVDYYYYQLQGGYTRPYLHFLAANSLYDNASYYDGNGGFFFWILGYNTNANRGSGWAFPQDYDIIGIAEGFTRADYTLKLDAGISEYDEESTANVVPMSFEIGPDVDKVGYTVLKGIASGAAIDAEVAAIAKDAVDSKYATFVEAKGESFVDKIELDETGIYTLVAVGLDAKKKAQSNASINFKYILADDPDAVIVNVSASTTEAYVSKGYNPDASLAYTISGAGVTGVIPMFYTQAQVEAKGGIEKLVSELKADPNYFYDLLKDEEFTGALSATDLASVNDNGYTDIFASGVTPGTTYYVVVWATNGYGTEVAYDTMTTTGDPLPIYINYAYADLNKEYELADASAWCGTWNLYGIDYDLGGSLRSYLGKVNISMSSTPAAGPDSEGLYDEYVDVKGLFGSFSWLEKYGITGFDDTYEMDVYGGAMYTFTNALKNDIFEDCTVYLYSKGQGTYGWDYATAYWTCFIPVADGYYAFVDNKYGASYNFCGLGVNSAENGWLNRVSDQLLVDPAKDENGLAPKSIQHAINAAKSSFSECVIKAEDMGLTGKEAARAAIKAYMKGYDMKRHVITPSGVQGLAPVTSVVRRVAAKHSISLKPVKSAKEDLSLEQFDMRKKMK